MYILLRRECSSSRVLGFCTSDTLNPPNLTFHLDKVAGAMPISRLDPGGYAGFMLLKGLNDLNFGKS
jgi:hypothetical protein